MMKNEKLKNLRKNSEVSILVSIFSLDFLEVSPLEHLWLRLVLERLHFCLL